MTDWVVWVVILEFQRDSGYRSPDILGPIWGPREFVRQSRLALARRTLLGFPVQTMRPSILPS